MSTAFITAQGRGVQALSVHEVIAAACAQHSESVAVSSTQASLTYGELDRDVNHLAWYLNGLGVRRGTVVALLLNPEVSMVSAILAIWRSGGIYLPLDPSHPPTRLQQILGDSGCKLVISEGVFSEQIRSYVDHVLYLDAERSYIASMSDEPRRVSVAATDVCYLLYTSGSTGAPKGVAMSHGALVNKLVTDGTWGRVGASCRAALLTSVSFDASLAQMFLPLAVGGSVFVFNNDDRLEPERVWSLMVKHGVNLLDCTPSWLWVMLGAAPSNLALTRIVMGGEILTPELARQVRARFPQSQLVNIYGPTEACIDATAHELQPEDFDGTIIPVGRALPGYRVRVLDAALRDVPADVTGQLYIGGIGLANGYWRNAKASETKFIKDPLDGDSRLYATGDSARIRLDGRLEFLGRADHQIKVRGQRIELGEIECVLASLPGVSAAVVKAWPSANDEVFLVAYVVMPHHEFHALDLRDLLQKRLPASMVPERIVQMTALPVSPTGKVDRAQLPSVTHLVASPTAITNTEAATDAVELRLWSLWRDVLGIDDFSVDDNFFELGGHSLSAVRLVSRINAEFAPTLRTKLPIATLFYHPTVADIAVALARGKASCAPQRVIHLSRMTNGAAALFLLPPGTGVGLVYAGLARDLSGTLPVVSLQAVGLDQHPPGTTHLPQLAAQFIGDIERIQPNGEIRLCGYSAGGVIAHEMVRQLHARGRSVSHLFLIDPYCADLSDCPDAEPSMSAEASFWLACNDMIWDAMGLRGALAEPVLKLSKAVWAEMQGQREPAHFTLPEALVAEAERVLPPTMDVEILTLLLEGVANVWHAFAHHKALPLSAFGGAAWFIQPDADPADFRRKRALYWAALVAPHMRTAIVPGEHGSMLNRARTVQAIGRVIRSALCPDQGVIT